MKREMNFAHISRTAFLSSLIVFACFASLRAQTTTFTYQGRLTDSSMAASGTYDLRFTLYDETDEPIGRITLANVTVTNGVFTVQLNFNADSFPGANRTLEIGVRRSTETMGAFTTLAPRQPVTSTPYAIRALSAATANTATSATNATTATNATQLGGVAANQFVQTTDTRLSDARTPTAGSANYVQNGTTQQTSSNFNISGSGKANVFDAATAYNIGGSRVFNATGLFGTLNTLIGVQAGQTSSNTGTENVFVGTQAGQSNEAGSLNSFVGRAAGSQNSSGNNNSFFGNSTGIFNTSGGNNSFFGINAGQTNATGGNNTALGGFANFSANNLSFATAIGSNAVVGANDTIVLGKVAGTYNGATRSADAVQIPGTLTVAGTIGGTVTNATSGDNNLTSTLQSSSSIGTWLTLNNTTTGGRQWSVISTGSTNGEGAGRLLFLDRSNNIVRLMLSDAGANVTGNLTVSGAISGTVSNATNATNVSGGFVQLPLTTGAPPTSECDEAAEYGRQKVDAANVRLYICTAAGWKSTVLQ